jgi:hypothetical protein
VSWILTGALTGPCPEYQVLPRIRAQKSDEVLHGGCDLLRSVFQLKLREDKARQDAGA